MTAVVRLNDSNYDRRRFLRAGINHHDLEFEDGTTPPDDILAQFLRACDREAGALAVHCKAGLGRTGTLIACWLIKHRRFTAKEVGSPPPSRRAYRDGHGLTVTPLCGRPSPGCASAVRAALWGPSSTIYAPRSRTSDSAQTQLRSRVMPQNGCHASPDIGPTPRPRRSPTLLRGTGAPAIAAAVVVWGPVWEPRKAIRPSPPPSPSLPPPFARYGAQTFVARTERRALAVSSHFAPPSPLQERELDSLGPDRTPVMTPASSATSLSSVPRTGGTRQAQRGRDSSRALRVGMEPALRTGPGDRAARSRRPTPASRRAATPALRTGVPRAVAPVPASGHGTSSRRGTGPLIRLHGRR